MYHQPPIPHSSMVGHGIHGNLIEITVVSCSKLKDTEWISRQDPYVCVEYGSNRSRTRTCTDGGKHPLFQEKFVYTLIEGLRELNVQVWNSNTLTHDDFIGSGKVQLGKVLSQGFDDSTWPLQTKTGRYAGEVRLIMHYANTSANKPANSYAPSAPPYAASTAPQSSMYPAPPHSPGYAPPVSSAMYPPPGAYPSPPPYSSYPPPNSGGYPPSAYPPQASPYPPQPYPPNSAYPPPYGSQYPPGPPYPGTYPPY